MIAKVISKSTIKAATYKEHSQTVNLTPWDLQFLLSSAIQKGLLIHTPHISSSSQEHEHESSQAVIHRLKASLSQTLDIFYPLAGRLGSVNNSDDGTVSFFIDCNNAGVEFVHAVADSVTVSNIRDPLYSPSSIIRSFFTLNDMVNIECCSKPFVGVQVTQLVDGLFAGCTFSHLMADGFSFCHFLTNWSEINRTHGSDFLANYPFVVVEQRYFLENADCPVKLRLPPLPDNDTSKGSNVSPSPLWRERVFHFTKQNVAALKAKANAELGTNNKISSLQALLAHLWRSVTRKDHVNLDQESAFLIAVGDRTRGRPPLPDNYFGNAVRVVKVSLTAREVLENSLGHVAWQIHKTVDSQNEKMIRGVRAQFGNSLVVSSSPRFNVYGVDFGWGRPVAVRSGSAHKSEGKLTLFAGSEEGSIDIEACFGVATLERMANDVEFMDVC